eukprot:TRINITY_DN8378_c0_g1_i1.p1 TRINITY_DN8378_c0_g1~~TRINITY_DN8378_c0_g1_i1.p1  ORF type:complete len:262 (-),score=50.45 TRINITY_DN8378_c0_g1_i1:59-844(-)
MAVSLGTSDTLFGPLSEFIPSGSEGNIMRNLVVPNGYMGMICRKNGSLTREYIRNLYAEGNWERFGDILSKTEPGNSGKIGFYFSETEITPIVKGFFFFDSSTDISDDSPFFGDFSCWKPSEHVRAVVESQFILMLIYSRALGFRVKRILATGGGSKNFDILQILSDVFGVPVVVGEISKSAALGAAYRAYHGWKCVCTRNVEGGGSGDDGGSGGGAFVPFSDVVGGFHSNVQLEPNLTAFKIYDDLVPKYLELIKKFEQK